MRKAFAYSLLAVVPLTSAATWAFPSPGSAVVGSLGFINGIEVGYFWDADRGDSVEEMLPDPIPFVSQLDLHLDVVTNVLVNAQVDWSVLINETLVGGFTVNQGVTGPRNYSFHFAPIASAGNYTVRLAVTNVVPEGLGSHSFAYAGDHQHSVTFTPEPSGLALLVLGLLGLRRR